VGTGAEDHDHWASWWQFTQAETRGRWVVVDRWLCAWVRVATGRGCGWWLAGKDRGPAVAEVWVGMGLADFSGSKPCPWGFEEGSGRADAKDVTREKLSFSVARAQQKKKELDLS